MALGHVIRTSVLPNPSDAALTPMPRLGSPYGTNLASCPTCCTRAVKRRYLPIVTRKLRYCHTAICSMEQDHKVGSCAGRSTTPDHPDLLHAPTCRALSLLLGRWCVKGGHRSLVVLLPRHERRPNTFSWKAGLTLATPCMRRRKPCWCHKLRTNFMFKLATANAQVALAHTPWLRNYLNDQIIGHEADGSRTNFEGRVPRTPCSMPDAPSPNYTR
mmetsp:Transcript_39648/g.78407  ORF Transcript_39648/g.78407 Transcript_39648/m.78407 type:complete len:216 (+) Transcript_39648:651-1298(+)